MKKLILRFIDWRLSLISEFDEIGNIQFPLEDCVDKWNWWVGIYHRIEAPAWYWTGDEPDYWYEDEPVVDHDEIPF